MQDTQGITPGSEGGPHHKRPGGPGTDRQRPKVTVRVALLPNADNFQIHLFGCLAAQEREFSGNPVGEPTSGRNQPKQKTICTSVRRPALKSHPVTAEQRQNTA